ncbi:MAG: FAD-dependent thymidylate synthase, partial [Clostridia bacterium]|nr:FAD-dependent thymidylate synthase [Clostridia bacterium]
MIIVPPSFEFIQEFDGVEMLKRIERIGRVCYKSEEKITEDSYKKFIAGIVKRGHESVIEHEKISVKITCDRGVTHEIVRHRLASYSQESTRYCNYAKEQ